MTKHLRQLLFAAALCTAASATQAQLTEIKVSYQPALYWSLPFYVAEQKGWWAELGLKPTFSTFPAGVPQIAASASKSMGSPISWRSISASRKASSSGRLPAVHRRRARA